jgi:CBS domain-containing protein
MKSILILEMIERAAKSAIVPPLGTASPVWLEPGAPRMVAPSQDVITALLFLGVLGLLVVLSVATLNYIANRREKQRGSLLGLVRHTTLSHAMVAEFRSLLAEDSLGRSAQTVMHTLQNHFPVVQERRPVGSLSRSAFFSALEKHGPDVPLRDVMQPPAPQAEPTETVPSALRRFRYSIAPFLWIVENGILVGLVTPEGLEQYLRVRAAEARNSNAVHLNAPPNVQSGKARLLV